MEASAPSLTGGDAVIVNLLVDRLAPFRDDERAWP